MKHLLLIVNPSAGQKKARKYLLDIIEIFNRAGYIVTSHITESPGDGEAAAMRHASEMDLIVCCGGDGTFNETISGVLKSGYDIPIGYIPAGSTMTLLRACVYLQTFCMLHVVLQSVRLLNWT